MAARKPTETVFFGQVLTDKGCLEQAAEEPRALLPDAAEVGHALPDGGLAAPRAKPHKFCKRKYVLEGTTVGRWSVLECVGREDRWNCYMYRCRCTCGTERVVSQHHLVPRKSIGDKPASQSCGCLVRDINRKRKTIHGALKESGRGSKEWRSWQSMKQRCRNSMLYIRNGITVCPEWAESFVQFLQDVGPAPSSEHTIDRIDAKGNYVPGNVRWATPGEQARNTSRTRLLTHQGRTLYVQDWANALGISPNTIHARLHKGLPLELVLLGRKEHGFGKEGPELTVASPSSNADYPWRSVEFTAHGETLSLTEWAERLGVDIRSLRRRLLRGLPAEEVLQPLPERALAITFRGETLTLVEWAERFGVSSAAIYQRLRTGCSVEDALQGPKTAQHVLTHNGESLTLSEWAKRLGVASSTLYQRLRNGWPIERILQPFNFREKYSTLPPV